MDKHIQKLLFVLVIASFVISTASLLYTWRATHDVAPSRASADGNCDTLLILQSQAQNNAASAAELGRAGVLDPSVVAQAWRDYDETKANYENCINSDGALAN